MTFITEETNRLVGVLVDRRGRVQHVMLGDAHRVYLPDIGRQRGGSGRFRGLRLVRTHITSDGPVDEALTRDDFTDLSKLRLDTVAAVEVGAGGYPGRVHWAHLIPDESAAVGWQVHRAPAASQLDFDFVEFIQELESEFQRKVDTLATTDGERAMLVYVDTNAIKRKADDAIAEMLELANTAGIAVVEVVVQRRPRPDPKTVVGKGKLETIVLKALQKDIELIIFGCDLAPRQMRAVTDATDLRVIDRTQLILDIFAQHATTSDGKLQVELAQLKYTLPRLIAKNTGMSRLMGGIGGRGPGETKLEINRRRARDRIRRLEKQLGKLADQRSNRRRRRNDSGVPVASIVGYTNAGKSTLLNTLTQSTVTSEDKLFATLVPTTRRLRFPDEREIVLTDTVGFIHDLPKDLVAAFKATLEELEDADLLIHLVDVSTPGFDERIAAVNKILGDLELDKQRQLLVLNKVDQLPPEESDALAQQLSGIPIAAIEAGTTRPLVEEIEREFFFADRGAFSSNVAVSSQGQHF